MAELLAKVFTQILNVFIVKLSDVIAKALSKYSNETYVTSHSPGVGSYENHLFLNKVYIRKVGDINV